MTLTARILIASSLQLSEAAVAEPAAVLSGIASVQDGDGLLFGDVEVRLQGKSANRR